MDGWRDRGAEKIDSRSIYQTQTDGCVVEEVDQDEGETCHLTSHARAYSCMLRVFEQYRRTEEITVMSRKGAVGYGDKNAAGTRKTEALIPET